MDIAVENQVSEEENHLLDEDELHYTQFKRLGKMYLPNNGQEDSNGDFLKRGNVFYQIVKDKKFNELLLQINKAPYFWVHDSYLNKYLKNFFRLNPTVKNESNSLLEFLDFFSRWVQGKSAEEKKFYANSAIDVLRKRKFTKHFVGQILECIIYMYDPSFGRQETSVDMMRQAIELIPSFKFAKEVEDELGYYLWVFVGFVNIKLESPENAINAFENALFLRPDGINAKFYLSLINAKGGNEIAANNLLNELYDYDLERAAYAMEENNNQLFNAYCHENIIQNVFRYKEFLSIIELLSGEIGLRIGNSDLLYAALKAKLIDFNNIEFTTKLDEGSLREILFVEKILSHFQQKNNLVFLSSLQMLEKKFYNAISSMMHLIANRYETEIQENLVMHDQQIEESHVTIKKLQDEMENTIANFKEKYDKRMATLKEGIKRTVEVMEDKIANLANQSEYNVFTVFKNNMFYNLFFALIVVLIVGFANYSNNYISEISNMQKIVSSFILTGAPWGIVSFFMGAIFSLIHLLTVITERNQQKVVLLKKIERYKSQKEKELIKIKHDYDETEKSLTSRLEEKVEFTRTRIENLLLERKAEEDQIRESFKKEIERETIPLKNFLPS